MKKSIVVLLLLLAFVPSLVFAARFHSVPLGHEAYRIIEVAEIRGIIPPQTDVKPYNLNTVRSLLNEIRDSNDVSQSERNAIDRILDDFDSLYGSEPTSKAKEFLTKGYFRTSGANTTMLGANFVNQEAVGYTTKDDGGKVLDTRNGLTIFIRGDILDYVSYDLNFRMSADIVDINADTVTDLKINCDGFYLSILDSSIRMETLPDDRLFNGIESYPEISSSIKDDLFTVRIGTVLRDWGPGMNNIGLSGSARAFDAFEFSLRPTSWFNYSVATGSLGFVSLVSVDGVEWPSENMDNKTGAYYNNLSIHRVELGPFNGVKFNIWESVVWRKRFELTYINPFAIYMFSQNNLGDYDNCLAGFDGSWTIPGVVELYAAIGLDELYNKDVISNPRNMFSYQVGAKFAPKFLQFSEIGLQATYIPAFFGAHYGTQEKVFGDVFYTTAYVNKGQNLGYPVNPDTIELLASFKTSLSGGWKLDCSVKDQMRSAQYASKNTGTDILTYMSYEASYADEYEGRDFFNNIWNNIVDAEITVEKKLDSFPVTLSFGLRGLWEMERTFDVDEENLPVDSSDSNHPFKYNPGTVTFTSDWNNTFTACALFGAKIYY